MEFGGLRWKFTEGFKMGPVGFEPTTKGFTGPGVSTGSGLSLHPRTSVREGAGCSKPVIKGIRPRAIAQPAASPQVVSAPSGGLPPARLRIAMKRAGGLEGSPESIPSTSRVSARRHPYR